MLKNYKRIAEDFRKALDKSEAHCRDLTKENTQLQCNWFTLCDAINAAYTEEAPKHKKPTEYMRGLQFAMDVIERIEGNEND